MPEPESDVLARRATATKRAAASLLAFSLLTTLALVAWFARVDDPWHWTTVVSLLSAALGLTAAALVWRAPSRTHVSAGIGVMAFSVLRVGFPTGWTWSSVTLLAVTILLVVPLVQAVIVLPQR